jgi:hypothetical protein
LGKDIQPKQNPEQGQKEDLVVPWRRGVAHEWEMAGWQECKTQERLLRHVASIRFAIAEITGSRIAIFLKNHGGSFGNENFGQSFLRKTMGRSTIETTGAHNLQEAEDMWTRHLAIRFQIEKLKPIRRSIF